MVGRQAHPCVRPGGLGVILVNEAHPLRRLASQYFQLQGRIAAHFLSQRAKDAVGHVGFLPFQHGQARGRLGDTLHHQAFDMRGLAPVVRVRLQDYLDPRLMADQAIGARTDRLVLEGVAADGLDVFLGHNPANPCGHGTVEGQKIGPGLVQAEADVVGIDNLNGLDLLLQLPGACPPIALEAELDVFGGERVAVVKLHALPQLEVIRPAVLTLAPLGGE